jgi:hypothetical protein
MSTTRMSDESVKRYYRVDRREIAFIKFILEAYDGLAMLETLDPTAGMVVFHIAPGCEAEVNAVLQDLKREILIEEVRSYDGLASSKFSSDVSIVSQK